jgi:tetratricopeptide (TPR) repeat protein
VKYWRMICFPLGAVLVFVFANRFTIAADPTSGSAQQERAVSALEQDVKADPNNAELWLHLGFAYRKLDQIDKAQEAFEKTTALNPKAKDAFFMLGIIYESKHRNADAVQAWKSYMAIETSPDKRDIAQKHIHHLSQ